MADGGVFAAAAARARRVSASGVEAVFAAGVLDVGAAVFAVEALRALSASSNFFFSSKCLIRRASSVAEFSRFNS